MCSLKWLSVEAMKYRCAVRLAASSSIVHSERSNPCEAPMPKMSDSRRKKIQAKQRQALNTLRRERKAARRAERAARVRGGDAAR